MNQTCLRLYDYADERNRPVVALGWVALGGSVTGADAPQLLDVKTTRPSRGEIIRYVSLPGTIKANQQATLYAKIAGYLKSLSVEKGDRESRRLASRSTFT